MAERSSELMRRKLVIAGLLFTFLGIVPSVLMERAVPEYAQSTEFFIGWYPNSETGSRAAMQCLADEIKRQPDAQTFIIHWSNSWLGWLFGEDEQARETLTYARQDRIWGSDYNGAGGLDNVTDQKIQVIAKAYGTMSDLSKYGCNPFP